MNYQSFFKASQELPRTVEIANRERLLAAVVEHTPECVKLIDADGVLLDMNEAGLTLIEADDWESVQGANVYDLMAPEHLEKFRQFNAHVCSGNKASLEFEIIALKGTRRWMHTTAVPLQLPDGTNVHLAITRDVTVEKKHAFELQQAKEKAEAASIAKSEFLANMSHEIRTPMTAILGYADLLLENNTDPENVHSVETIKSNGNHLLEIINDILDISKIEAGKFEIENISCAPRQILTDIYRLHQARAAAKGLALEIHTEGSIPEFIESDPLRLRQILINLVGNAIKFTEEGTVRLITRMVETESSSPQLEFEVADTGIGMTEEELEKIFKTFSQADSSTSRKYGGTGLGLTISKRLAEMLGGDIQAQSMPGKGSSFTVKVAVGAVDNVRMLDHSDEMIKKSFVGKSEDPDQSATQLNCRVLFAEDGPDNQRLISHVLKKAGATVTIAENGQVAYDLALAERNADNAFDLILMDMQMPVLDGYVATQQLRAQNYTGPIIALTAHTMSGDRAKCLDAGCDDYLQKPINVANLVKTVQRWSNPSYLAE